MSPLFITAPSGNLSTTPPKTPRTNTDRPYGRRDGLPDGGGPVGLQPELVFDLVVGVLASGELSTRHVATHELPLDEAPYVYDMFKHKKDGCVRTVIRPNGTRT